MDMTKSDVCLFLTRGTKNAHCATCAFIPYAGFSQIRSHILIVASEQGQSANFLVVASLRVVKLATYTPEHSPTMNVF